MHEVLRRAARVVAAVGSLTPGAGWAMDSCAGQYAAALIRALPAPLVLGLDIADSTPMNVALAQSFTQGLKDAGQAVGEGANANAFLTLSYRVSGLDGGGGGGGGGGGVNLGTGAWVGGGNAGWAVPSEDNTAWLSGGQTAVMPGIPNTTIFTGRPSAQPATLFMRAEVRPSMNGSVNWVATIQCTIQGGDTQRLAYQLGQLIGGTVGRRVESQRM